MKELLNNIAILISQLSSGKIDSITNLNVIPEDLNSIVKAMNLDFKIYSEKLKSR